MIKVKNSTLLLIFTICLSSCFRIREADVMKNFYNDTIKFKNLQDYINIKYVNNSEFNSYTRIIFLGYKNNKQLFRGSNMVYDTIVVQYMNKLGLSSISVEQTGCDSTKKFTAIQFDIDKLVNNFNYYYYYDYCDSTTHSISENNHYKTIPLIRHWFLIQDKGN